MSGLSCRIKNENYDITWDMSKMDLDKTKWTRKDQKLMKCICCDKFTIYRYEGWWIHKKCLREILHYINLWKASSFGIKMEIMDWEKAILSVINYDQDKIQKYNEELTKKAFEIFNDRYGSPSWVKNPLHKQRNIKSEKQ